MKTDGGYVDIHTHILPGVDDGPDSLEKTIHMLKMAQEQQIDTIIATPHYEAGGNNPSVEELLSIKEKVQKEASKMNPQLKLLLGNELYYSESIVSELKANRALTLADSRYVLVEFSTRENYQAIFRGIGEIIRAGYLPILAHVERYQCLYKKGELVKELVDSGCYIQINCSSLVGGIFDTEAKHNHKLINRGLVHLIGSDCHDDQVRVPNMTAAIKTLLKKCDQGIVQRLIYENPMRVIENTYI